MISIIGLKKQSQEKTKTKIKMYYRSSIWKETYLFRFRIM